MKCKKCGREINESSIETCFDCRWQEERSYDVKLFDVELFNLFSFFITKNTKYNSINFSDFKFSPNFDYKYKYISLPFDPKEFLSSMFFGIFFGSLCLIAYFMALSQKWSAPSYGLYLSLGLFFMGGLSLFISFIPPYLNFNPDISNIRKHCMCNIDEKSIKFEYYRSKTNEEEVEEPGKLKLSIYAISDQMEQVKLEIPKENIKGIEIRKIYEIENEYEYKYIYDVLNHNDINKNKNYYAFYVCFVNPIYIYDEKKKNKQEMIELKEIRLISHIFSKSVDLEKLKNEFENVLGLNNKS